MNDAIDREIRAELREVILSGDHQKSVDVISKELGITEAHGSLSPQDKLDWVKSFHSQFHSLKGSSVEKGRNKGMMLGDGINDALILAAVDVSLTFSDASDLARSNCDFIILANNYKSLGATFQLMNKTRRITIQNLGWAVLYNLVAIPAAVMGFVTPWMAALGMSLSSLLVVLNSLRLKSSINAKSVEKNDPLYKKGNDKSNNRVDHFKLQNDKLAKKGHVCFSSGFNALLHL